MNVSGIEIRVIKYNIIVEKKNKVKNNQILSMVKIKTKILDIK